MTWWLCKKMEWNGSLPIASVKVEDDRGGTTEGLPPVVRRVEGNQNGLAPISSVWKN